MNNPKPICVIYWPGNYLFGRDKNWIYEFACALNGDNFQGFKLATNFTDYHWFCFYDQDIHTPEFKVFHAKDITEIEFEDLKKLVLESIKQTA
jgi:hypothetical protein